MKLFMYILAFTLGALGYLSLPYLAQIYLMGCKIDFIRDKKTIVTMDDTSYFYYLDSDYGVWSKSNLKIGDAICSPI